MDKSASLSASMTEREHKAGRSGNKAKIFTVRRDPEAARKDIIVDKNASKFRFVAGSTYKGEWRDNAKHGFGIQTQPDGTSYEGEWVAGKRHGIGTLWVRKGKTSIKQYSGNWAHGQMNGAGVYSYDNGDVYSGEWVDNKRNGLGRLDFANGDVYEGFWIDGMQQGPGVLNLANGNRYDGHWVGGLKEGPGKFFYAATNKVYEGEWVSGDPKCGEFRDPRDDEHLHIGPAHVFKHQFQLPELALQNSRSVLDSTIASTRMQSTIRQGIASSGIRVEALEEAEKIYRSLDSSESGAVEARFLGSVFSALGLYVTPDDINYVMQQFSMDNVQDLTFPEVVEISSFLLSENAN